MAAVRGALQGAELLRYVEGAIPQGMSLLLNVLDATRGERLLRELQQVPLRPARSTMEQHHQHQHHQHQHHQHQQHQQKGHPLPLDTGVPPAVLREMANVLGQQLAGMPEVQALFDDVMALQPEATRHRPNASQLNVYPPNGGIPFHVDARGIGAVIWMVSFQSPCVMELVPAPGGMHAAGPGASTDSSDGSTLGTSTSTGATSTGAKDVSKVLLEPLSLLVLAGPARYEWAHRVAPGNPHMFQGREVVRSTRTSFVFWSTKVDPGAPRMERPADFRERLSVVSSSSGGGRRKTFSIPS